MVGGGEEDKKCIKEIKKENVKKYTYLYKIYMNRCYLPEKRKKKLKYKLKHLKSMRNENKDENKNKSKSKYYHRQRKNFYKE